MSVYVVFVVVPTGLTPLSRYTRYVIGSDTSVDAAQEIWTVAGDGLVPLGRPCVVGGVASGGALGSPTS